MIEFDVENDFMYLKLENLIPLNDPILLKHFYVLREIFINKYMDYGKEFLLNQHGYMLRKLNDKELGEDTFFSELKNNFTRNEILFLAASLFACEGTRIR
jgi:hypothetical protein